MLSKARQKTNSKNIYPNYRNDLQQIKEFIKQYENEIGEKKYLEYAKMIAGMN